MKLFALILAALVCSSFSFSLSSIFGDDSDFEDVTPVQQLDLTKYAGTWYEISHLSMFFQRNCYCTTATYTLKDDGTVGVHNSCNWEAANGTISEITGTATAVDGVNGTITTGKL